MLDIKKFADALKQRYSHKKSSIRDVTLTVSNPKKDKENEEKRQSEVINKLRFFKSKKAKDGLPKSIRQNSIKKLIKKLKPQK